MPEVMHGRKFICFGRYPETETGKIGGMSATTRPFFTPAGGYAEVVAQQFAQALKIPLVGGEATVLITCLGSAPAVVTLSVPAASTTGTAAAGSSRLAVASAAHIAPTQIVLGANVAPGTIVTAISGTPVTLSQPLAAALSRTALVFIPTVTNGTGVAVAPGTFLPLGVGANSHISFISHSGLPIILNIATGS
jgi:hypothetical protein